MKKINLELSLLGSFLYRKRRALKLSRNAFAKKLGMSYPGIYYLETGKQKTVYPPTLQKISTRLSVDIKKLLKLNKKKNIIRSEFYLCGVP